METKRETRALEFEIHADKREDNTGVLTGVPIVFNAETDIGPYTEVIERDALTNTDMRDVRFLVNHDTSKIPLARSRNNNANSSMQMTVEEDGLHIRVNLDIEGNTDAMNLYSAVKRGDVSGMSFMFTVEEDAWADLETDHPKRTIRSIGRIFEVSACTFPAYSQTSIEAAGAAEALESAKAKLESLRAQQRAKEVETERRRQRLRILLEVES